MNWFTKRYTHTVPLERKEAFVKENDCCEHVQANPALLVAVVAENDPWGSESYGRCQECDAKAEAEEGEEDVVCFDCNQTVKAKDTISWKWYDFYAPQGDEPLTICNTCRTAEKHRERVRKDRAELEEEQSRWDD